MYPQVAPNGLQIFANNVAGGNAGLEGMKSVVKTHFGARHEDVIGHDVLGAK